MTKKDKNIDAYIANSKPFAQPILKHIRKLVHQACPEVEETMKWGFPHFIYRGILCGMASFQEHCAFGFWKGSLMKDPHGVLDKDHANAMGQFGRIANLQDLPPEHVIISYIQEAMKLNEEGIKLPKKITAKKKLPIPDDFNNALKKNKKALEHFENFPPSKQQDYIEWVVEAKQQATREKRIATAVGWLSEGKSRNWKYE